MIEATLNAWASAIGCDTQVLERRLVKFGFDWKKGMLIPATSVLRAYYTDEDDPKKRLLTAQAKEKERENRIADKEICVLSDVEKLIWEHSLLPLRQSLETMPETLSVQCNPEHPELAKAVLESFVESIKNGIREKIPNEND